MPNQPDKSHYRRYPIKPLALGLNDALNPALLQDGETPSCENVDFDAESVAGHGGAIKLNNQPAPHSGLLTRVSHAPLYISSGKSVPQRGYGFIPYAREQDIGGDFELSGTLNNPTTHQFHGRRGSTFSLSIAFSLPAEEKLYGSVTGSGAPVSPAADISSYDEALEECTLIAQKGGDAYSPLSWAIGIVNTGAMFEAVTGSAAFDRASNYALVFIWYDAPAWGGYSCAAMRYLIGAGGANVGTTGRYCTMGLRAIIAKAFIEPGRQYQVAVNLRLDSGSPGDPTSADPTAAWNQDGAFEIVLRDERGTVTRCASHGTDLFSWKGPADNYDYLTRYGVRFAGRDPVFLGLGMRFAPWAGQGFAPFGLDSASMEQGGHRMVDVSAIEAPSDYPAGQWCTAGVGTTYLALNLRGMHGLAASSLPHPTDPTDLATASPWPGLYDAGATVVPHQGTAGQSEALRNCWAVIWGAPAGTQPAAVRGGRIRIAHYTELAGTYRLVRTDGLVVTGWATQAEFFVIVFRWHQRPLRLASFRIWKASRDYTSARVQFSLGSYSLPDDKTEPNIESLVACYPLDDAGGGVLRELVRGATGYLAPYGLGKTPEGGLFLSGEGEALALDFSADSILGRELVSMLRSGASGFAVEVSCVIPQAYYARQEDIGSSERRTLGAPILVEWALKEDAPAVDVVRPLLRLGHRARLDFALGTGPFYFPCGFNVEVDALGDQEAGDPTVAVAAWGAGPTSNWSTTAEWVGERIRLQVGVQSTGTDDQYRVYLAASPKSVLNPASGDPSDAEFAYYATVTIPRRDLARSVVTIGGAWRPESWGYTELNARMIVEDVRVFGCAAPGALPSSSGGTLSDRSGKLFGARALPPGRLTRQDLLAAPTPTGAGVNVTADSSTVTPADRSRFWTGEPEASLEAVKETFLIVAGDDLEVWIDDTVPAVRTEFYYVSSVAAGGASLTLARPFNDATMRNVAARSFRMVGYTAFSDSLKFRALQLARGAPYSAGATDPSDAVMNEGLFANLAPTRAVWSVRVFSTTSSLADILPQWDRAPAVPRRNRVLGMASHRGVLYGCTRGALYVADDRWRDTGPTETIKRSMAFLGRRSPDQDVAYPAQADALRFDSAAGFQVTTARLNAGGMIFDAWVKLDDHAPYQTSVWVGSLSSNPAQNAGSAAGAHKCHLWLRFASGAPELALGSTATYDGTNRPAGGLFIARAAGRVSKGEWVHVRWVLTGAQSGTWVSSTVRCFVNGRSVNVRLLATENGAAAGSWLNLSNLVSIAGCSALLGVARDSLVTTPRTRSFTAGVLEGDVLLPARYHGYLHPLDGALAQVGVTLGAGASQFQPHALTLTSPTFLALESPEGVGHKALDSGGAQYGVVESHPAISLFHEMGPHENPASFARYGAALFATTGGRPVYVRG